MAKDRNTIAEYQRLWGDDAFVSQYLSAGRRALYAEVARDILEVLGPHHGIWVAEVGCGTGHVLRALVDAGLDADSIWGVDFSAEAIERAKIVLPGATFLVEDLFATTLPIDVFDLVLCVETLEHLARYEIALDALLEFASDQGLVIVTVPNGPCAADPRHVNRWTRGEFQALLARFGKARTRLIGNEQYILGRIEKC